MPDLATSVKLIVKGVNETDVAVDGALAGISRIGIGASLSIAPLGALVDKMIEAEVQAIKLSIAFGDKAFQASERYKDSVVDLQKFVGDGQVFDDLEKQIGEISLKYGEAAGASLDAAADWIKAGKEGAEVTELFALSLDTAIAGEIELAEATTGLKIATENYKTTAVETRENLDFLNNVADNTANTFGGLFQALTPSIGIAAEAGISFQKLAAVTAGASARSQEYNEVGRAMRNTIATLIDPSKEQATALIELGVAQNKTGLQALTTAERFDLLFENLQSTEQQQKEYTLAVVAGKEQVSRITGAVAGYAQAQEFLAGNFKTTNTLQEEAERSLEKYSVQIDIAREKINRLLRLIGAQYAENLTQVITSTGDLASKIREQVGSGRFDGLFDVINKQLLALDDAIKTVTTNLPEALGDLDFTKLENSIDNIVEKIKLALGIDLTTVDGLREALQLGIDLFANLTNVTAGYIEQGTFFSNILISIAGGFADLNPATAEAIGNFGFLVNNVADLLPSFDTLLLLLIAAKSGGIVGGFSKLVAIGGPLLKLLGKGGLVGALGFLAVELANVSGLTDAVSEFLFGEEEPNTAAAKLAADVATANAALQETPSYLDAVVVSAAELSEQYDALLTRTRETTEVATNQGITWRQLTSDVLEYNASIDTLVDGQVRSISVGDRLTEVFAAQGKVYDEATGLVRDYIPAIDDATNKTARFVATYTESGRQITVFDDITQQIRVLDSETGRLGKVIDATEGIDRATKTLVGTYTNAEGKIEKVYRTIAKSAEDNLADKTAAATEKALKAAQDYQLELAKLASDERIAKIEAQVAIDTTRLQADAEKSVAIIGTINTAIESTGTAITDAFSILANVDPLDRLELLQFIKDESARRAKLFDRQDELLQAQIQAYLAQASRLRSKDPYIQIDGSGLQTELQALAFAMLRYIQVNVVASGGDFSLGNNPFAIPAT